MGNHFFGLVFIVRDSLYFDLLLIVSTKQCVATKTWKMAPKDDPETAALKKELADLIDKFKVNLFLKF